MREQLPRYSVTIKFQAIPQCLLIQRVDGKTDGQAVGVEMDGRKWRKQYPLSAGNEKLNVTVGD